MRQPTLLQLAHQCLAERLYVGATAIDATLGNGHDTVFLAEQVGANGRVYGFDIQSSAIEQTRRRLQQRQLAERVTLLHISHAHMHSHLPPDAHGTTQAIMFNLGYLPGGDKTLITLGSSTLAALNTASSLLSESGRISILVYPGHTGGADEYRAVHDWIDKLDQTRWQHRWHDSNRPSATAPRLVILQKRSI
jgi:tRNA1(Val) A37 N6-methylase TrmN6